MPTGVMDQDGNNGDTNTPNFIYFNKIGVKEIDRGNIAVALEAFKRAVEAKKAVLLKKSTNSTHQEQQKCTNGQRGMPHQRSQPSMGRISSGTLDSPPALAVGDAPASINVRQYSENRAYNQDDTKGAAFIYTRAIPIDRVQESPPLTDHVTVGADPRRQKDERHKNDSDGNRDRRFETACLLESAILLYNLALAQHMLIFGSSSSPMNLQQKTLEKTLQLYRMAWDLVEQGLTAGLFSVFNVRNRISHGQQDARAMVDYRLLIGIHNNSGHLCYELGKFHDARVFFQQTQGWMSFLIEQYGGSDADGNQQRLVLTGEEWAGLCFNTTVLHSPSSACAA